MKKVGILLSLLTIILILSYFFLFVIRKKVSNPNLLEIQSYKSKLVISTRESAKYICCYKLDSLNDSQLNISVYTTSVYNIFASKTPTIEIPVNEKFNNVIVAGKTVR